MSECGGGSSEGGVAVSDLQLRGGGGGDGGVASNHSSAESPPEMPLPSANVRKHRPTSAGPDTGCGYDLQFMSRSLPSVGAATASPVALPPPGSERPSMAAAAAAAPFCTTSTSTTFPAAADIFSSGGGVAPPPTLTTTTTTATTTMAALPTVTPPHTLQELLVSPQDYYADAAAAAPAHAAADASPRLRLRTPSPVSSTSSSPPSPPPPENRLTMAAVVAGLPVINHQYRSGSCGTSHLDLREASGTGDGAGVGYPHCSLVPASQADSVVADDDNLNHVFFTHEALSRQRNMLEEADARADLPFFASFALVPWHSSGGAGGAGNGRGDDAATASEAMSSPPPPPSPSYSDSLSPRSGRAMASPLRCSPRGRSSSPRGGGGGGGGVGRSASPTRGGRGRLAGVAADEDADRTRIEDECFSSMLNMYRVALLWAWRAGSFSHPGVGGGGGGGSSAATRGGGGRPSPCPPPDALDAPPYGSSGFASPPPVSGHHHHPHHPSSSSSAAGAPRSVAFAASGDAAARSVSTPARGRSRSRSPGGYSEGGYSFSFYSESPVRPKSSCGASVAGTCPVVKPCPSPKEVNHRGSLYMSTGGGEGVWVRRYFALINGVLYCGRSNIDPAPKVLLRSAALMAVESDDRLKSANAAGAMSAPPGGAQRSHGFLVLLPPAAERFARQTGDGAAAQHQMRSPSPGGASAASATATSAYTRVIRFSAPTASSRAAWVAALRDGMVDPSPFLSTSPPRFAGAVGGGGS